MARYRPGVLTVALCLPSGSQRERGHGIREFPTGGLRLVYVTVKRRLISALLGLVFVSATVAGGAPGCALRAHGEHGQHGQPGMHASHGASSAVNLDASSAAHAPSDAEHHAVQCDMAMACSMVASVGEGAVLTETLPVLRHVVWGSVTAPQSVLGAPEPPPPRA